MPKLQIDLEIGFLSDFKSIAYLLILYHLNSSVADSFEKTFAKFECLFKVLISLAKNKAI